MPPFKLPYIPSPCDQCPFRRNTLKGWLGAQRMQEICEQESFVCHKTIHGQDGDRRQCAGHMLLRGPDNEFVALAERMQLPLKLSGKKLVFKTVADAVEHHRNNRDR